MKAILFDLDGTLLPLNFDSFMRAYFRLLAPHLEEWYKPDEIAPWILRATKHVVENENSRLTNEEKFRHALFGNRSDHADTLWPIFERFYQNSFDELRIHTQPTEIAREICRTVVEKGYRIALATNPIFPSSAIQARMQWAGIDDIPFDVVTTMESTHFCKPNPKYFLEIADALGVSPESCLMVGNDVQEDGAATYLGMKAYLVKDHRIDRGVGTFPWVGEGTLQDFRAFANALPSVYEM